MRGLRGLKIAVVVMGVLIVAGIAIIGVTIARRVSHGVAAPAAGTAPPAAAAPAVLDEPAGTRIAQASADGDRLVLRLEGGGPDRVAVLDLRNGRVVGRVGLAR